MAPQESRAQKSRIPFFLPSGSFSTHLLTKNTPASTSSVGKRYSRMLSVFPHSSVRKAATKIHSCFQQPAHCAQNCPARQSWQYFPSDRIYFQAPSTVLCSVFSYEAEALPQYCQATLPDPYFHCSSPPECPAEQSKK